MEQRTAKGRIDIVLETKTRIYIMELKFDKTAEEALAQDVYKRQPLGFWLRVSSAVVVHI